MSNNVITVDGLSKSYMVGHNFDQKENYYALRDVIARNTRNFARKTRDMLSGRPIIQGDEVEEFWALKDVSFEVKQGDRVGIIGKNGAGKSTILKILSRITEPTKGRIKIRGRVASLLEVGTGFHPELTGRENIFLNGAILGMSRKEIQRKFDEIVDFSEVSHFLDTPVKRYSSGMYVRLAFAVAANLDPEILIVDEVLAVGDAHFQKKCLGKMESAGKEGRTVLFVSHNLSAIQNLCTKGIFFESGEVKFNGNVNTAIETYMSAGVVHSGGFSDLRNHRGRAGNLKKILTTIALISPGNSSQHTNRISIGDDLIIEVGYSCAENILDYMVIGISTLLNERVLTVGTHLSQGFAGKFEGDGKVLCHLPKLPLVEGEYQILVAIGKKTTLENIDFVNDAVRFCVTDSNFFGTGKTVLPGQGFLAQSSFWSVTGHKR